MRYKLLCLPTLQQRAIRATVLKLQLQFNSSCKLKNFTQNEGLGIKQAEAIFKTQNSFEINPYTQNMAVMLRQ